MAASLLLNLYIPIEPIWHYLKGQIMHPVSVASPEASSRINRAPAKEQHLENTLYHDESQGEERRQQKEVMDEFRK